MKYDLTIHWTDPTRERGYQATTEDLVIEAGTLGEAITMARESRPDVRHVQVHGLAGRAVALVGPTHYWSAPPEGAPTAP